MKINPYLFFKGNCEEAFKVYADVFGGKCCRNALTRGSPRPRRRPRRNGRARSCMRRCSSASRR